MRPPKTSKKVRRTPQEPKRVPREPQETPRAFNTGPRGPRDGPKRPPRRPKMGSKTVLSELPELESNATIFLYKWSHHFRPDSAPISRTNQAKTTKNPTRFLVFVVFLSCLQGASKTAPRAPRERSRKAPGGSFQGPDGVEHNSDHPFFDRLPQEGPQGLQEGPKSAPRAPQEGPKRAPRESKRLPK